MMYEYVLNNEAYLRLASQIGKMKFITDGKWDWEHGLDHYRRVAMYVKKILEALGCNEREIDLGMTASLLHDIGLSESGPNKIDHALRSSELFPLFLYGCDITHEEEVMMKEAIKAHSKGEAITSMVGLALLLGDKFDATYHRTIHSSIQDAVNLEFQKIRDVDIYIDENDLIVSYVISTPFSLERLQAWEKAFTIPPFVAHYLKRNYYFKINGDIVTEKPYVKCFK